MSTIASDPETTFYRAPATSIARALAAFATLVLRYTGEERQPVRVTLVDSNGDASATAETDLAFHRELSVAAALEQAVAALEGAGLARRSVLAGEHLTFEHLARTTTSPGGAPTRLFVTVRGGDAALLSGMSQVVGMLSSPVPARSTSAHWRRVMVALVGDEGRAIGRIPLLGEAELELLALWSRDETIPEIVSRSLLHELFEWHASREPRRVALDCAGVMVTYGELDARANQLAHHLRARGVGVGAKVAFQLPRSVEVYVALLAVLKTGAAYVPLDPSYPRERVAHVLADANAHTFVTTAAFADLIGDVPCELLRLDVDAAAVRAASTLPIPRETTGATPRDVCYVIYTSGSTGRPKGVAVEHRSACHLVRAEAHLFPIVPRDRVFQGFSIAFDAAVEEVWLAFFAGATLVVGTQEMVAAGAGLAKILTDAGVTVLSCVPTLLSMLEDDLPTVRLLILGGEECPRDLVARWAKPGRRMVNTYGPTEATVIATYAELRPHAPPTIGKPIPNTTVVLLDAAGEEVPPGAPGEIHLGGVALARGYVGQPEMTAARFIERPRVGRLYRTGDLGRYNPAGEVEFLGRADQQVKLRGFRIELSEIESAMMTCAAVQSAVVALREDVPGVPMLVGYVLAANAGVVAADDVKAHLRRSLPPYMIPSRIVRLDRFPVLSSGKVDRASLPPPAVDEPAEAISAPPLGAVERAIAGVWSRVLGVPRVGRHDDFFGTLGGHSLAAARAISELRKTPASARLSVVDLYAHPTVAGLAVLVDRADERETDGRDEVSGVVDVGIRRRHFWCGVAQAIALYGLAALYALEWVSPYLAFVWARHVDERSLAAAALVSFGVAIAVTPISLAAALATKWIVIGRYRAGRHPLWGAYYFRHWLVETVTAMAPLHVLSGTPLAALFLRAMGARVGRDVHVGTTTLGAFDLVSLGDGATIEDDAAISGATVEDGALIVGRIDVGKDCFVGTRSVLAHDTRLADGSALEELSMLSPGGAVPAGATWSGSPARSSANALARPSARGAAAGPIATATYALLALTLPTFLLAAFLPGFVLLERIEAHTGGLVYLAASPLVSLVFVASVCAGVVVLKWLLVGRVRAGTYPLHGSFGVRKWAFDQLMRLSLRVVGSLYATLYLNPWYRALGVTMGANAEVSTAPALAPDLLEVADEAFVADCAVIGGGRIDRATLTLAPARIGRRAFVGNSAVVPPGASVADDALLGVLSRSPAEPAARALAGASWLGSPPISLPQRQASAAFGEEATYRPTRALVAQRLAIEAVRVLLPSTCFVLLTSVLLATVLALAARWSVVAVAALVPLLYVALGLAACAIVVAIKWIVIGRYRPAARPLWSHFVWRAELVSAMQENLADTFFGCLLKGTPFLPWFFRALGATIGERVYLASTELTEYDLVEIGDEATLDRDCTMQTHLFEDRVMKMATVSVGARCSVGADAVVLYDARMETGATLGALSLLMKGEVLPRATRWEGTPARACRDASSVREPRSARAATLRRAG